MAFLLVRAQLALLCVLLSMVGMTTQQTRHRKPRIWSTTDWRPKCSTDCGSCSIQHRHASCTNSDDDDDDTEDCSGGTEFRQCAARACYDHNGDPYCSPDCHAVLNPDTHLFHCEVNPGTANAEVLRNISVHIVDRDCAIRVGRCRDGFTFYPPTGKCFKVVASVEKDRIDFNEALAACEKISARIVTIYDEAENKFLAELGAAGRIECAAPGSLWIGLCTKDAVEYYWQDHSPISFAYPIRAVNAKTTGCASLVVDMRDCEAGDYQKWTVGPHTEFRRGVICSTGTTEF